MHFSILLCHTSLRSWNDSSRILLSPIVTALLIVSTTSKHVPLKIPLILGKEKSPREQNQLNREVCSRTAMFLSTRKCWMLSTPSLVTFQTCQNLHCPFSCSADLRSFEQLTDHRITTHRLPHPFDLSTACWRLPVSGTIFHPFVTLFEPLVPLKNRCAWYGVISIHLLKSFKCLWHSFPQPDQKWLVYLFFITQIRTTWKRWDVNKNM